MRLEFRTQTRGYTLLMWRDLLGHYVVFRRWYGLSNRRGGTKQQVYIDESDAIREIQRVERIRYRHGYRRV